jgi:hypothetical protein
MEAPIPGFSRYVAYDYDLDGVLLPGGSRDRHYGATNHDSRQFPDPDRFDVPLPDKAAVTCCSATGRTCALDEPRPDR